MKKTETVFYGTITTDERNRGLIEALGADVGDYDRSKGFFYVRAAVGVASELENFGEDFKCHIVPSQDLSCDTLRAIALLTTRELASEQARLEWLIHSGVTTTRNDADACEWIELWKDLLARVSDRLSDNKPTRRPVCLNSTIGMGM